MRHMYSGTALLVFSALVSSGAGGGIIWADDELVTYEVITKDPPCTALHMESMGVVTRLTPLRDDYNLSEIVGGVPMFVQVPAGMTWDVERSLLELPQVLDVQRADPSMRSNHTAPPLDIDSNSYTNTILTNCYPAIPQSIEKTLRDAIIQRNGTGGAVSVDPAESCERVTIYVYNISSMIAYLEENGAHIHSSRSAEAYGEVIHSM